MSAVHYSTQEVARHWNKAPAIWFPWRLDTVIGTVDCRCGLPGAGGFAALFDRPARTVAREVYDGF